MDRGEPRDALRHRPPIIVGVGGTLREGSTSERALALALKAAAEMGQRFPEAKALVAALRRADGIIFSSPAITARFPAF